MLNKKIKDQVDKNNLIQIRKLNVGDKFTDQYRLVSFNKGFKPHSTRSWSRDLKNLYNQRCFISGALPHRG